MPAPAPVKSGSAQAGAQQASQVAPTAVVPFVRGSGLHRESVFDSSFTLGSNTQDIPPIDINAYGYMRSVYILVSTTTPGGGTAVVTTEDGPWNVLQNIQLMQPNGFPFYQVSSGYSAYLIHKYGGYQGYNDPKAPGTYSYAIGGGTAPSLGFGVRIPVELNIRDALGSLPNKNAASPFKLKLTLNTLSNVFGGSPTTPTIRVRVYLEAWDQPADVLNGQAVQITPPAMNTIQYWTESPISVQAGQFNARSTRMGNYLREHLYVLRRNSSTRANGETDFPDPITILIDQRNQDYIAKPIFQTDVYEKWGYSGTIETAGARDNGVFPYDWAHEFDGRVGHENRDLWLPTIEATRYELSGVWGNAGVLTLLTNDVAPQGNVFV
jgi:hypothetical protein